VHYLIMNDENNLQEKTSPKQNQLHHQSNLS